MIRRAHARRVVGSGLGALLVALAPTAAHADSAAPTDYRSEVVRVDPPAPAVEVSIEGGDAFVMLVVRPGTEVVVHGYQDEPYLWFTPDGSVYRNANSPATYINEERYGGEIPTDVSPAASPEWQRVATDRSYAWHDHRAHRMEPYAPVSARRGDRILDGSVPLLVDGTPTTVQIVSTWMPAPSPWPAIVGGVVGAGAVVIAAFRRGRGVAPVLTVVGAAAAIVGAIQYRSLPDETGPRALWWLLPLIATGFALASWLAGRGPVASAFAAIAALQLLLWGLDRRTGITRAVLPTDLPFWLDRFVTAAAIGAGAAGSALAITGLLRPLVSRRPARARA